MGGEKVKLTNMVMVQDPATDRILMQHRTKKGWAGITMPGGHLEAGESIRASAIREISEETGLTLRHVELRGVAHWERQGSGERFLTFLYRCRDFTGELLPDPPEGRLFWAAREELPALPLSPNLDSMLEVILREDVFEAYALHPGNDWTPMQLL